MFSPPVSKAGRIGFYGKRQAAIRNDPCVTISRRMIRQFRGVQPQIHPTAYVDVSAQVIGDVQLGGVVNLV